MAAFHNGGAGGNGNQAPGRPIIHHEYHEHRHFHYHHFTTPEFEEADRQDVEQHLKPQLEAANPTGPLVHYHHYFHRVQIPPPPPLNHQAQGGAQQHGGQGNQQALAEAAHGDNIQVDQQQAHIQVQEDDDGAEHGNVQEEGNNNEADQEQGNNNQANQEDGAADGNNDEDGM